MLDVAVSWSLVDEGSSAGRTGLGSVLLASSDVGKVVPAERSLTVVVKIWWIIWGSTSALSILSSGRMEGLD